MQRVCRSFSFMLAVSQELIARNINTFAMNSGLSQDDFGWGSASFHKMVLPFFLSPYWSFICAALAPVCLSARDVDKLEEALRCVPACPGTGED